MVMNILIAIPRQRCGYIVLFGSLRMGATSNQKLIGSIIAINRCIFSLPSFLLFTVADPHKSSLTLGLSELSKNKYNIRGIKFLVYFVIQSNPQLQNVFLFILYPGISIVGIQKPTNTACRTWVTHKYPRF